MWTRRSHFKKQQQQQQQRGGNRNWAQTTCNLLMFACLPCCYVAVSLQEMSSLSVEPSGGDGTSTLLVSVFEIPLAALPAFFSRETEFRWVYAPIYSAAEDGSSSSSSIDPMAINGEGLLCAAYSDEEYKSDRLQGSAAAFHEAYGRWGIDRVWRDDLLPCRVYLRHCVLAAAGMDREFGSQNKGEERETWGEPPAEEAVHEGNAGLPVSRSVASSSSSSAGSSPSSALLVTPSFVSLPCGRILSSFLDQTFLGDRRTTIREYLKQKPHVMLAQPPESLKERYSG